jgi:hypothetical protein
VPDVEVLAVYVSTEFGPVIPPVGTDHGGVELLSDINIY